ncbi:hypothetical protein MWU31_24020 [Aeromonas hydrophila]|nr:hypothetical protein [Aeromonas hydrophila]MCK0188268.1 hypothetical protein [Aeromonas hydrophila]UOV94364.1 hypothetical protein MUW98_06220 [Aeromonas hydrophila]
MSELASDWSLGASNDGDNILKQYQNWLAQYLICRRDNDHAMAAELAEWI